MQTSMDNPDDEPKDEVGRPGLQFDAPGDDRREIYDRMPMNPLIDTAAALRRMPAHWLTAACHVASIDVGPAQKNRKARSAALFSVLFTARRLEEIVAGLPPRSRRALCIVLESGGCVALIALTQEFGEMDGDGWLWDDRLPTSVLGELRSRALLHIGRLQVEQDGGLPDLQVPIAVVPHDLRPSLCMLLNVFVEESLVNLESPPAVDDLNVALNGAQRYFDQPDHSLGLTYEQVVAFLRTCVVEGFSPSTCWQHLDLLFEFAAHNLHEIRTIDDLCGFHLSELATEFADQRQVRRWLLAQRRALIETVDRLYGFLREQGLASADTHEEVTCAARMLLSGKRRLKLIRRPVPLGGEAVFMYDDENAAGQRTYTINHRRIAVVWWSEFDQDWDALLMRCDAVVDGHRKAEIARELMNADAAVCELLLACADEDEPEFVAQWFRDDPVLFAAAW
jgi:hypothetical protein